MGGEAEGRALERAVGVVLTEEELPLLGSQAGGGVAERQGPEGVCDGSLRGRGVSEN